uniref:U2A'/phosphoprotein 32 family A C-terminal domain-containing protein n=1 Tax=Chromera velia CCMP2878 TaxID=1169474 RepID=A0A0G4IFF2_9ALVE|eukprot:Cvel_13903.t1-p1 / transcript=Cvel_13903.t1 / gene=Cvel_13903 / organism=Chromera_velia_CCMP2878 / gene_product=Leucine-rich repeat-containing protein 49, putative / transcript_product=Leucine-rich repeat-containing protein 49, putative / location=Cvel_scaffold968:45241-52440(+) / protein_length=1067 / sequence_SO=supercontig / SO=protein_coding / is_pseudo=false
MLSASHHARVLRALNPSTSPATHLTKTKTASTEATDDPTRLNVAEAQATQQKAVKGKERDDSMGASKRFFGWHGPSPRLDDYAAALGLPPKDIPPGSPNTSGVLCDRLLEDVKLPHRCKSSAIVRAAQMGHVAILEAPLAPGNPVFVCRSPQMTSNNPLRVDLEDLELSSFPVLVSGPSSVENVGSVQLMSLRGNRVHRLKSGSLAEMGRLRVLDVGGNRLEQLEGLEGLSELLVLLAGRNQLSRLTGLEYLCRLDVLDLGTNLVGRSLRHIEPDAFLNLKELRILRLTGNRLRRLEHLSHLVSLVELSAGANEIESARDLSVSALPNLSRLFLENNRIDSLVNLHKIPEATKLKELALSGNPLALSPSYRSQVLECLPRLSFLDGVAVPEKQQIQNSAEVSREGRTEVSDKSVNSASQHPPPLPPPSRVTTQTTRGTGSQRPRHDAPPGVGASLLAVDRQEAPGAGDPTSPSPSPSPSSAGPPLDRDRERERKEKPAKGSSPSGPSSSSGGGGQGQPLPSRQDVLSEIRSQWDAAAVARKVGSCRYGYVKREESFELFIYGRGLDALDKEEYRQAVSSLHFLYVPASHIGRAVKRLSAFVSLSALTLSKNLLETPEDLRPLTVLPSLRRLIVLHNGLVSRQWSLLQGGTPPKVSSIDGLESSVLPGGGAPGASQLHRQRESGRAHLLLSVSSVLPQLHFFNGSPIGLDLRQQAAGLTEALSGLSSLPPPLRSEDPSPLSLVPVGDAGVGGQRDRTDLFKEKDGLKEREQKRRKGRRGEEGDTALKEGAPCRLPVHLCREAGDDSVGLAESVERAVSSKIVLLAAAAVAAAKPHSSSSSGTTRERERQRKAAAELAFERQSAARASDLACALLADAARCASRRSRVEAAFRSCVRRLVREAFWEAETGRPWPVEEPVKPVRVAANQEEAIDCPARPPVFSLVTQDKFFLGTVQKSRLMRNRERRVKAENDLAAAERLRRMDRMRAQLPFLLDLQAIGGGPRNRGQREGGNQTGETEGQHGGLGSTLQVPSPNDFGPLPVSPPPHFPLNENGGDQTASTVASSAGYGS